MMQGLAMVEHWAREGGDEKHQRRIDEVLGVDDEDDDGVDMSTIDPATGEPVGWSEGVTLR